MSLSIWDLIKYLYKWRIVIILVTILSFAAAKLYVSEHQTYSAKTVIQYNDKCISNGKTLDGELFDSNEIKSPTVILNVLKELGYENKKIESVREHISISPVIPKTVDNLKEAKEKLGEEYQFFPKTFAITYNGNSSFEATRDILSSVIANYFNYYSERYLYLAALNEVDYDVNKKNYDYIEQAEQINDNVEQTIELLSNYSRDSAGYRSSTTGLTFDDLMKEFELIEKFSIPKIFSKIYEGQISKNETLLISKYQERFDSNELEMYNLKYKADLTLSRMNSYAEADKKEHEAAQGYGNGEAGTDTVMQGIEHDERDNVDEQTTYDGLMNSYANDSVAANNKKIDAEYCKEIIDCFKAPKNPSINYEECEKEVETSIAEVLDRLKELYEKANINISDYNAYIPALHIKKLSGVSYYGDMSGSVYELIAIICGFVLSCLVAIVYEVMKKYSLYSVVNKKEEESEEVEEAEA